MGALSPSHLALLIRRVLLIANPAARRARPLLIPARDAFVAAGVACDIALTERPGHAAEIAAERGARYDAVFALGGDGTAMEAAGALAGTACAVGVLAGGTGNLLARALGIPLDVRRAVPALLQGEELLVDLGRFESGRRFAVAAGVGIDAAMVAETPGWLKRRLGVLAYTIIATRAALRSVLRQQFFRVRVTVDGEAHDCPAAAAVMVANFGAVLDNRITFGPGIHSDDGVLDVCIYSPRNLLDAFRIMWRVLLKRFASDRAMLYRSGKHIRVETEPVHRYQADGELLGMTPFEITVEPCAARLLVPRR